MSDENMSEGTTSAEYTVDELARAAGTMTTTVRMYQAKGLLPSPRKRGRVAVYDSNHLERLRLIATLQQRGHSLAGIADLIAGIQQGADLPELIGVRSWGAPRRITLSATELAERFAGLELTPADLGRGHALGLIEFGSDGTVSADERFVDVGVEIARMGVPVGAVLDEWQSLQADAASISARFTSLFERVLWPALEQRSASVDDVAAVLDRLGPLAQRVVALALESAMRADAAAFAATISE